MTTLRDAILAVIRSSRRRQEEVHRKDLFDEMPAPDRRKRS